MITRTDIITGSDEIGLHITNMEEVGWNVRSITVLDTETLTDGGDYGTFATRTAVVFERDPS